MERDSQVPWLEAGRIGDSANLLLYLGASTLLSRLQNGNAAAPPQGSPEVMHETPGQGIGRKGCTWGRRVAMGLSSNGPCTRGNFASSC